MAMTKRSKVAASLLTFVGILVLVRLALPTILLNTINGRLAELESYHGHVEDIDLALWRGAYVIDNMVIRKRNAENLEPFVVVKHADLATQWSKLFEGALVAELQLHGFELNLVEGEDESQSQTGTEEDWRSRLDEFFPIRFDKIEVDSGIIRFRAPGIEMDDALTVSGVKGHVFNLTNARDHNNEAFSPFSFSGTVLNAPVQLAGRVDPVMEQPTFDLNLTLKEVELTAVNPWLQEYLKADAEAGTFAVYLELAAANGEFEGYAKPFMENVNMFSIDETDEQGLFRSIWESIVELTAELFENQPRGEVASRVPISGTIEEPEAGVAATIFNVVRNAFLGAFTRSLEHSVELPDGGEEEQEAPA